MVPNIGIMEKKMEATIVQGFRVMSSTLFPHFFSEVPTFSVLIPGTKSCVPEFQTLSSPGLRRSQKASAPVSP